MTHEIKLLTKLYICTNQQLIIYIQEGKDPLHKLLEEVILANYFQIPNAFKKQNEHKRLNERKQNEKHVKHKKKIDKQKLNKSDYTGNKKKSKN